MMRVEIHDRHPLERVSMQGVSRTDGDIVEDAVAHRMIVLGMMTWRPHIAVGRTGLTVHCQIHAKYHRPCRPQGRFENVRHH